MDRISGIVAGSVIGALSAGLALSDARTRKRLEDSTKKITRKEGGAMSSMS